MPKTTNAKILGVELQGRRDHMDKGTGKLVRRNWELRGCRVDQHHQGSVGSLRLEGVNAGLRTVLR